MVTELQTALRGGLCEFLICRVQYSAVPYVACRGTLSSMAAEALYGFVGVLLGSGSTAMLTVYRERLISRREREALQHQREQDRKNQRDTFQRQSLLALAGRHIRPDQGRIQRAGPHPCGDAADGSITTGTPMTTNRGTTPDGTPPRLTRRTITRW